MKNNFLFASALFSTLFFASCSSTPKTGDQTTMPTTVDEAKNLNDKGRADAPAPSTAKKYDIKSGVITYETLVESGTMKISGKTIIYFDNYGNLECKETFEDGKLTESFFSDGKNLFKVMHNHKTAYNVGVAYSGTEYRFDFDAIAQKDKDSGNAKKSANETVAGKNCEAYSFGATSFAGWNHICLLTKSNAGGVKSTTTAVKIEENVAISPDKFKAPADYKLGTY